MTRRGKPAEGEHRELEPEEGAQGAGLPGRDASAGSQQAGGKASEWRPLELGREAGQRSLTVRGTSKAFASLLFSETAVLETIIHAS